jgi:hypothetical protein
LSPEQNTKSESENVNTNVLGVSISKQSTCLLEVSGCFLGFWNRLFSNLALTTSEYSKSASAEDTAESMQEQINHDKT